MQINLLKGLNEIEFGITKDSFLEKYTQYQNVEIIDEEEELKTEAVILEDINSSIYFEGEETEMILTACETENKDAILFGDKIFNKTENEIIELMKAHNFSDQEEEVEEWGEKRVSFFDAMVDFYFEKGKLISVSWGILLL